MQHPPPTRPFSNLLGGGMVLPEPQPITYPQCQVWVVSLLAGWRCAGASWRPGLAVEHGRKQADQLLQQAPQVSKQPANSPTLRPAISPPTPQCTQNHRYQMLYLRHAKAGSTSVLHWFGGCARAAEAEGRSESLAAAQLSPPAPRPAAAACARARPAACPGGEPTHPPPATFNPVRRPRGLC